MVAHVSLQWKWCGLTPHPEAGSPAMVLRHEAGELPLKLIAARAPCRMSRIRRGPRPARPASRRGRHKSELPPPPEMRPHTTAHSTQGSARACGAGRRNSFHPYRATPAYQGSHLRHGAVVNGRGVAGLELQQRAFGQGWRLRHQGAEKRRRGHEARNSGYPQRGHASIVRPRQPPRSEIAGPK